MPLVNARDAHTVLPLYPGMMIRRSKGRILRDGSGAFSPQPRARAVSPAPVRGYSRQPLLDACRKLKALYAPTAQLVGLFRGGRLDLCCDLEVGAATTVSEPDNGDIRFV